MWVYLIHNECHLRMRCRSALVGRAEEREMKSSILRHTTVDLDRNLPDQQHWGVKAHSFRGCVHATLPEAFPDPFEELHSIFYWSRHLTVGLLHTQLLPHQNAGSTKGSWLAMLYPQVPEHWVASSRHMDSFPGKEQTHASSAVQNTRCSQASFHLCGYKIPEKLFRVYLSTKVKGVGLDHEYW